MKKTLIILITLGVLLAAVTVAQAQELVIIPIHGSGTYTFHADDDVILGLGWITCTPGLSQVFKNAYNISLTLDGDLLYETVKHDPYWTPVSPAFPFDDCIADPTNQNTSKVYWIYPLEYLEPGAYELHATFSFDHKLLDGFDFDQDGKIDFFEGEAERNLTLIVLE